MTFSAHFVCDFSSAALGGIFCSFGKPPFVPPCMPPFERVAFSAHFVCDFSSEDSSESLNISPSPVNNHAGFTSGKALIIFDSHSALISVLFFAARLISPFEAPMAASNDLMLIPFLSIRCAILSIIFCIRHKYFSTHLAFVDNLLYFCIVNLHKNREKIESIMERQERIAQIRKQLRNGDINRIAKRAGVSREWVSRVLQNRVVSEPVLKAAEAMLAERQSRPSEHS